jgi:hypothetical protein
MAQKHSKYSHIFVVVRLPKEAGGTGKAPMSEQDVMLTKAFPNREVAESEVARLNELNGDFWHYFPCVARLVDEG